MNEKYLPTKKDLLDILKEVKDPQSNLSILELGLVKSIDYIKEKRNLIIKVDFLRRNPSCAGCLPIAWFVQKKIMDDLYRKFKQYKGIEVVDFIIA